VRRAAQTAAAVAVVAVLAWSVRLDVPHSFRLMNSQHAAYAAYDRAGKERVFGSRLPMPMDVFDFWRSYLRPGDRYWINMPDEAFSTYGDKRFMARTIAHLYFLPALEAPQLKDATIVLTWDLDPRLLPVHYTVHHEAGLQLIFASRVARGS